MRGLAPFVFACAVCFGDPNSSMTRAAQAGVLFLLGVVFFVLAGVAATILVWMRRARRLERAQEPTAPAV